MHRKLLQCLGGGALLFLGLSQLALAHEAYVVPRDYFWQQMSMPVSLYALHALQDPHNVRVILGVVMGVLVVFAFNFLFRISRMGRRWNGALERLAPYGPLAVRAAIAIAFFYSAFSWSFLGPERGIAEAAMVAAC